MRSEKEISLHVGVGIAVILCQIVRFILCLACVSQSYISVWINLVKDVICVTVVLVNIKKMLPTSLIENSGMCFAKTVKFVYEAHMAGVGFSMPFVYFKIT